MEQPKDYAPNEPFAPTEPLNDDPAFAPTEPLCPCAICNGDFDADFYDEDEVREPMTASERAFVAVGYLVSGILVCVGLGAVVGWVLR